MSSSTAFTCCNSLFSFLCSHADPVPHSSVPIRLIQTHNPYSNQSPPLYHFHTYEQNRPLLYTHSLSSAFQVCWTKGSHPNFAQGSPHSLCCPEPIAARGASPRCEGALQGILSPTLENLLNWVLQD